MSRSNGVLGRLQQRVGRPRSADEPREEGAVELAGDGDKQRPKILARDTNFLLDVVGELSPSKQLSVYERWPFPAMELGNGISVIARTKKERRRFEKPIEPEVLAWLGSMSAGDVFFDIGANCGSLTLAAGGMHRTGIRIVAIEPGFANFESLVRNLSRNRMLDFTVPLQIALMDQTGLAPIHYYGSTAAGTSLHSVGAAVDHEDNAFTPVEVQTVPAFTLDDAVEILKLPAPTHVKVDVDGTEGPLLEGATRTLRAGSIKDLLVEVVDHDRNGSRLASIKAQLAEQGYELAEIVGHNEGAVESFVADYLFRRA